MRKATQFIILSIISGSILTACSGKSDEFTNRQDINKTVKVVKTEKKENKPSPQKSSDKTVVPEVREDTQETVDSFPFAEDSVSGASDTQISQESGLGVAMVTSGRLDLWADTPVYAEPNKSGAVAFTKAKNTSVEWDRYFQENSDWWYSFVDNSSGQEIRYYIAYSDVQQ